MKSGRVNSVAVSRIANLCSKAVQVANPTTLSERGGGRRSGKKVEFTFGGTIELPATCSERLSSLSAEKNEGGARRTAALQAISEIEKRGIRVSGVRAGPRVHSSITVSAAAQALRLQSVLINREMCSGGIPSASDLRTREPIFGAVASDRRS